MRDTTDMLIESWAEKTSGSHTIKELLKWISGRNRKAVVAIEKIPFESQKDWIYMPSEGVVRNSSGSFFTVSGIVSGEIEQPIIMQNEIGYLGMICREIDGVLHFLMQAKIEPGNINKVQISPTIQATKSNFAKAHGGKIPPYLDFFLEENKYEIVVDQIQSEQSSRFLKKRNRNIVIRIEGDEVPVYESHCWMTLWQIKELMKYDNLVNMDTRTVISCLPIYTANAEKSQKYFSDTAFYNSVFSREKENQLPHIYSYINNLRMFSSGKSTICKLSDLKGWSWIDGEFRADLGYHFKMILCDIAISGREVKRWTQPLFEATGTAVFGLICCEDDGVLKFLVKAREEIGSFDGPELGPTVQLEADEKDENAIDELFFRELAKNKAVMHDVVLSEEGGRFYHEQNRNAVVRVPKEKLDNLPDGYFLLTFRELNSLVQINNCLNIQLRNLLALLEL